jgi:hypothetical protein
MARRVIEEIDSHLRFRKPLDIALTVAFVVFYVLIFAVYAVNSVEPMVLGLSFAYFYSLVLWVVGMAIVVASAKFVWR